MTQQSLTAVWVVLLLRPDFFIIFNFPFHELHERSIQIYEKLILHVQIEQGFPYPVGRTASKYFFNFFWFSSKNFLPTPDSISSSSLQNLEEDLPLLTNVFHVTSRNRGSFLKQEREPWERDWVTTSYQEYQDQFSCCSRGVLPSVLNNEGSRGQI